MGLADYYHLPCRTGGSLTDTHLPDAQSLLEGTLCFQNALANGANYILHSFGMMSSYLAVSLEKFVLDEEMATIVTMSLNAPEINNKTLDLKLIETMGSSGDYLTHSSTVKHFRQLFRSNFLNRAGYEQWSAKGRLNIANEAAHEVNKRLANWVKPTIDQKIEQDLKAFIGHCKQSR
jgi:trimethylamine--corrinoid protein Co-methyltransferase